MLILSASAALCSFISPDSVLGGFTKSTTKYWNAKAEGKGNSNFVITEALYNTNGKILTEVSKYQDGTPKQSINYQYDAKGNIDQISVFNDQGILSIKKVFKRSNDTLEAKLYKYHKSVEEKIWEDNIIIEPNKQLEHSTMADTGEDDINYMSFSLSQDDSKTISIKEYLPKHYRQLDSKNFPKYECKYDTAGRITETLRTDPDGDKETSFNLYDGQGRLLETSILKSDGTKEVSTFFKYEDNGSKTEYERNIYGTNYLRYITRYDEKGRVFEKVELHPSGEQRSIITRKFDDKNRIIEVTQNNPDDSKIGKHTFEYDEFGNSIKNVEYSPTNEVIKTVEYVYSK
jgi:hypothetical protein